MSEKDERGVWSLFHAVVKATTDGLAGHLPNCGYTDAEQVCGCAEWGTRLYAILAAAVPAPAPESGLRAAIETLIASCRGNTADDADGGEPLRNYVLISELRPLLATAVPVPVPDHDAAPAPRRLRDAIQPTRSHGAAKEDQR